jgi:cyclophilin family peptidyl-prolyl cis-trans isomerase
MGKFECELYESKAPVTVANFVGLARGIRPSQDPKGDTWEKKKFYDGIVFHRVIKDFMLQTGDPTGSGTGGPGYVIPDEFGKGLAHRGKGIMSMANRGKNTGSSQFFITVADTPHLDGKHPVFGQCEPEIPVKISEVKVDPRRNNRPYEPVKINTIEITRKK